MDLIRSLYASHYFSNWHFSFIVLHVTLALVALVVAPVAMAVAKGGKAHRRWGLVYFWSMIAVNGSALLLLTWRFNIFLFGITVLTLYSVVTGYRALRRKRPTVTGQRPTWFDWSFASMALLMGSGLFGWGVATLFGFTAALIPTAERLVIIMGVLPIVFGLSIGQSALTDLRLYRNAPTDRNWWWYYHMERMVGSYIGLFTALMVQQVGPRMPGSVAWIVWVAPSLIGTILLTRWIASYRRKFASTKARSVAVPVQVPAAQPAE